MNSLNIIEFLANVAGFAICGAVIVANVKIIIEELRKD